MNKQEDLLLQRAIELSKDKKLMKEIDAELVAYKLKFGKNWLRVYMSHLNQISKNENELSQRKRQGIQDDI